VTFGRAYSVLLLRQAHSLGRAAFLEYALCATRSIYTRVMQVCCRDVRSIGMAAGLVGGLAQLTRMIAAWNAFGWLC